LHAEDAIKVVGLLGHVVGINYCFVVPLPAALNTKLHLFIFLARGDRSDTDEHLDTISKRRILRLLGGMHRFKAINNAYEPRRLRKWSEVPPWQFAEE
jgi:hypothetical protein